MSAGGGGGGLSNSPPPPPPRRCRGGVGHFWVLGFSENLRWGGGGGGGGSRITPPRRAAWGSKALLGPVPPSDPRALRAGMLNPLTPIKYKPAPARPPPRVRQQTVPPPPPCVTFRRVVVSLRGPGQSPGLPFACCVGSLLSVGRCGRCSC